MAESNALFMTAAAWRTLGGSARLTRPIGRSDPPEPVRGYDEGFKSAGGGLVNLDTWKRACSLLNAEVISLLGEGTFHQIHGGIATNSLERPWPEFHTEYIRIRGHAFKKSAGSPIVVGTVHPSTLRTLAWSAQHVQPLGC